jgi:hypothetical protein
MRYLSWALYPCVLGKPAGRGLVGLWADARLADWRRGAPTLSRSAPSPLATSDPTDANRRPPPTPPHPTPTPPKGYAGYTLMYETHKSWYSWVLGSLVGAVYTFGFILMCPQLYLNYKLKSVAHLPWRQMTYKFLNTIIDDLFAFVIKMPTLHRLSVFRDDIVFMVFLYQVGPGGGEAGGAGGLGGGGCAAPRWASAEPAPRRAAAAPSRTPSTP